METRNRVFSHHLDTDNYYSLHVLHSVFVCCMLQRLCNQRSSALQRSRRDGVSQALVVSWPCVANERSVTPPYTVCAQPDEQISQISLPHEIKQTINKKRT